MRVNYSYRGSCLKTIDLPEEEVEVVESGHKPETGDVVAVRIVEKSGDYGELDMEGAETVDLKEGDVVLGAFGNRAGLKGYVGEVPSEIRTGDRVEFIGAGGLFAEFKSATAEYDDPYEAEFLGYVEMDDKLLNTENFGVEPAEEVQESLPIVAVVATRMEAGKTTLASNVIEELTDRGYAVGALKLTGSTRERDRVSMFDSGAEQSYDFVDAGLVSTVTEARDVVRSAKGLINEVSTLDIDLIVVEFGAGLVSNYNVANVLRDLEVRENIDALCGVAITAAGAFGLREELDRMYYTPISISGPITDTTAGRHTTESFAGLPAYNAFRDDDVEQLTDLLETQL